MSAAPAGGLTLDASGTTSNRLRGTPSSFESVTTTAVPLLADSVRLRDEADGGGVDILDRRVYPHQIRWVHCNTVADVATAIREMVTQSSGPVFATSAGLVLAARAASDLPADAAAAALRDAGTLLAATRPTNNHIRDVVATVLAVLDRPAAALRWRAARCRGHRRGRSCRRPLSRVVGGAGAVHRRVDPGRRPGPDALLGGPIPHRRRDGCPADR